MIVHISEHAFVHAVQLRIDQTEISELCRRMHIFHERRNTSCSNSSYWQYAQGRIQSRLGMTPKQRYKRLAEGKGTEHLPHRIRSTLGNYHC